MANLATDTFTLKNDNKLEVTFIALGGRLISIKVPSPSGEIADVVIGYDSVEESINGDMYFAALCGRFANRISGGKFTIDGVEFQLDVNNDPNHLHGGFDGFNKRIWDVEKTEKPGAVAAYRLTLVSPDGDQKYPGELTVSVVYSLTADNQFCIEYEAETTKPTVINLTSHPYFNLSGSGDVLNHEVQIIANHYTPINPQLGTCGGKIAEVAGTAMDFTISKKIGEALNSDFEQVKLVDGIDHNFVINNGGNEVVLAAIVIDPESGRRLEVYTDQPGIQMYAGSHFDGLSLGKGGRPIIKYAGIALETQIFPNSPNCENYPNAVLRPGEKYLHTCIYRFN
jgi:aldose 1-epimerase